MSIEIVFETHALSEDNERGLATGWLPGRLCARGRVNAAKMGRRRREDGITAVFTSDLRRAAETAQIAFGDTDVPILYDWRLRECDFGARNGSPAVEVRLDRLDYCDRPYPGGESHSQAIHRVARFLADLPTRCRIRHQQPDSVRTPTRSRLIDVAVSQVSAAPRTPPPMRPDMSGLS